MNISEYSEQLEDLAVRITFFLKENDPKSYSEFLGMVKTDAGMVTMIKAELKDTFLLLPIINGLEAIIKGRDLSGAEQAKCYDMMTDLYHLYAEESLIPVFDRETEILYTALDALDLTGYELRFDDEGICLLKDGQEWHNEGIYQHLADTVSVDACREFLARRFTDYTDFKDLANHYGVHIGIKLRNPPLKFPERNDAR